VARATIIPIIVLMSRQNLLENMHNNTVEGEVDPVVEDLESSMAEEVAVEDPHIEATEANLVVAEEDLANMVPRNISRDTNLTRGCHALGICQSKSGNFTTSYTHQIFRLKTSTNNSGSGLPSFSKTP
jgi:hypothetical protein